MNSYVACILIALVSIYAAYWRRCKGGGWWLEKQGPWWADRPGIIYLWIWLPITATLISMGLTNWRSFVLAGLFTAMWNPGHSGLSIGRDPQDATAWRSKPFSSFCGYVAKVFASVGSKAFCTILLSLDYMCRTMVVAGAGYFLIGDFGYFGLAGLSTGPLYMFGWYLYDKGYRPVFMQADGVGGHLIGEWLNGGVLTFLFLLGAYLCLIA